jgi:hypothetical protein
MSSKETTNVDLTRKIQKSQHKILNIKLGFFRSFEIKIE